MDREIGGAEGLEKAMEILKEGGAIGIFPEGTRSRDGKQATGKTGVARLASATGAAVVPVAIRQTDGVWPVSKRIPRPWRKFYYKFGDPMYFGEGNVTKESLRGFTDKVMDQISVLSKECEEYWESKKLSVRFKKWSDSWRNKRKVRAFSQVKK